MTAVPLSLIEEVISGVWDWTAPPACKVVARAGMRLGDGALAIGASGSDRGEDADTDSDANPLVPGPLQQAALEFLDDLREQCDAASE